MNEDNTNTSTQNTNPPFNSTNIRSSPFPELVILGSGGLTDDAGRSQAEVDSGYVEYRVYPFRSLPSGRVVRYDRGGWTGYAGLGMLLWLGYRLPWEKILQCWVQNGITVLRNYPSLVSLFLALLWTIYGSCTSFYESVIPLPGLGIQLECSTTFHPPFTKHHLAVLSTRKTFIPLEDISAVVIHEGLTRWTVRYYLAIIRKDGQNVQVAFPNSRPQHAVLLEVYHGVREALYPG